MYLKRAEGEKRHRYIVQRIFKRGPEYSMSRFLGGTETLLAIIPCLKSPKSFDQCHIFYVESFQVSNLQASDKEHRRASRGRREGDSGWMGEMYRMCSLV